MNKIINPLFKTKFHFYFLLMFLASVVIQGCAPVFSELQSARTVGKSRVEFTPSFSTLSVSEKGESESVSNHIGVRIAYGITEKIDIRVAYERVWLKQYNIGQGSDVIGFGPKYSLLENKIAFSIPFGGEIGGEVEEWLKYWQLHPTFLFTLQAGENIDITLSPKYIIQFCEDCDNLVAANLGISFSSDFKSWALRPEYGILFNPGESGVFGQFSIGFTKAFGKSKSKGQL